MGFKRACAWARDLLLLRRKYAAAAVLSLWLLHSWRPATSHACRPAPPYWTDTSGNRRDGATSRASQRPSFVLLWSTNASSFHTPARRCIESIFRHHPNASVRVFSNELPLDFFQSFQHYEGAISVERFSIASLLQSTPAEKWLAKLETWRRGAYFYSHVTDILRLVLLYREGGVYLDTDIVLTRPLRLASSDALAPRRAGAATSRLTIPRSPRRRANRGRPFELHAPRAAGDASRPPFTNALGIESFVSGDPQRPILNGAIMIFEEPGSRYLWNCMHEFADTYNPALWGWNGPELLTRVHARCAAAQPGLVEVRRQCATARPLPPVKVPPPSPLPPLPLPRSMCASATCALLVHHVCASSPLVCLLPSLHGRAAAAVQLEVPATFYPFSWDSVEAYSGAVDAPRQV